MKNLRGIAKVAIAVILSVAMVFTNCNLSVLQVQAEEAEETAAEPEESDETENGSDEESELGGSDEEEAGDDSDAGEEPKTDTSTGEESGTDPGKGEGTDSEDGKETEPNQGTDSEAGEGTDSNPGEGEDTEVGPDAGEGTEIDPNKGNETEADLNADIAADLNAPEAAENVSENAAVFAETESNVTFFSEFVPLGEDIAFKNYEDRISLSELVKQMPETLEAYKVSKTESSGESSSSSGSSGSSAGTGSDPGSGSSTEETASNSGSGSSTEETGSGTGNGDTTEGADSGSEDSGTTEGTGDASGDSGNTENSGSSAGIGSASESGGSTEGTVTDSDAVDEAVMGPENGGLLEDTEADSKTDGVSGSTGTASKTDVTPENTGNGAESAGSQEAVSNTTETPDESGSGSQGTGGSDSGTGSSETSELVEIPVTSWECSDFFINPRTKEYIFQPKWNKETYEQKGSDKVPVIKVTFENNIVVVSTQKELQTVLNYGAERIALSGDIELSSDIIVPESANAVLDGQGHSLLRGDGGNNEPMIFLGGAYYTEEQFGTLALTNITIDGRSAENRKGTAYENKVGAPAVINYGRLILDDGAKIKNNHNYGRVLDGKVLYSADGGAVLAYRELILMDGSDIMENYANGSGGGVYLAGGATLYLKADVITGNLVGTDGEGVDLYASDGSTIYYDPQINMERAEFYICDEALLKILSGEEEELSGNIEIYLNNNEGSGYDAKQIEEIREALEALPGVSVRMPKRKMIDTTDLRQWYIYDHYDIDYNCWGAGGTLKEAPLKWKIAYEGYLHRPYYGYKEEWYLTPSSSRTIAYSIEKWLNWEKAYTAHRRSEAGEMTEEEEFLQLAQFKEHIYSTKKNGRPEMIFAGYGVNPFVDFLFYDPESDGEKVVEFDVDSSKVKTHTLDGNGFLVNTGLDGDKLYGYLIYYSYSGTGTLGADARASTVSLYKVNGVPVDELHKGSQLEYLPSGKQLWIECISDKIELLCKSDGINFGDWADEMSIRITASPDKIEVKQWKKDGEESKEPILSYIINTKDEKNYSGFGPLVAYKKHKCTMASSFTYSNLRMYFTELGAGNSDLLGVLEEADFTQGSLTKRYFLNLFGKSELSYEDYAEMGRYQEFLWMMQAEGIGLITDRETPFGGRDNNKKYLGENNLYDTLGGRQNKALSVAILVEKIKIYLTGKETTEWKADSEDPPLSSAAPKHPVGNIWLASSSNNTQIRAVVPEDSIPCGIVIHDISHNPDGKEVRYSILKPGRASYEEISLRAVTRERNDGFFTVGKNMVEWPGGEYVVRQQIEGSPIYGYSYFTLDRPVWIEEEEIPVYIPEEPLEVSSTSGSSSHRSSSVEPSAVSYTVPGSAGALEPKTADAYLPAMPVATGAVTAFMMKLFLWMYEMELGISEEKKDEMVQALIDWAKGTTKPKIYTAIVALTVVITAYHVLKALTAEGSRLVKEKLGRGN